MVHWAWGDALEKYQSQTPFYACPSTGQVSWDPPVGNFVYVFPASLLPGQSPCPTSTKPPRPAPTPVPAPTLTLISYNGTETEPIAYPTLTPFLVLIDYHPVRKENGGSSLTKVEGYHIIIIQRRTKRCGSVLMALLSHLEFCRYVYAFSSFGLYSYIIC